MSFRSRLAKMGLTPRRGPERFEAECGLCKKTGLGRDYGYVRKVTNRNIPFDRKQEPDVLEKWQVNSYPGSIFLCDGCVQSAQKKARLPWFIVGGAITVALFAGLLVLQVAGQLDTNGLLIAPDAALPTVATIVLVGIVNSANESSIAAQLAAKAHGEDKDSYVDYLSTDEATDPVGRL